MKPKVRVIDDKYPKYFGEEMYILWEREYEPGKIWYCLGWTPNQAMADVYLGPSQIEIL